METNHKEPLRFDDIITHNYIPLFSGRPKRETGISNDDVLNLKIALNSAKSFEEFFETT